MPRSPDCGPTLPAEVRRLLLQMQQARRSGSVTLHFKGGRCLEWESRLRQRAREERQKEQGR